MRRLRTAGRVGAAAASAAALVWSLAGCTPASPAAGRPFATQLAGGGAGSSGASAGAPGAPGGETTRAHATGVETGGRGSAKAARLLRAALADPDAIAVAGGDVWVANSAYENGGRGWVSEFSAATGALIRVVGGPRYGLADPQALAVAAGGLWVADGNGGGLTELSPATGALVRVLAGPRYGLADPAAIAADGRDLWVANGGSDSATEVNAATGALVRVIDAPRYQLSTSVYAPAIAVAGGHVWVPDGNGDAVTEIDAATGALIKVINAPAYRLDGPDAVTAAGGDVWVIDVDSGTVTEINAATGALVRVITAVTNVPLAIAASPTSVWLLTNLGVKAVVARPDGVVDEFSAATGQPVRRIGVPPFRSGSPGGAITVDGDRVWATDTNFATNRGWVAGLSAGTGAVVRVIGARNGHVQRS